MPVAIVVAVAGRVVLAEVSSTRRSTSRSRCLPSCGYGSVSSVFALVVAMMPGRVWRRVVAVVAVVLAVAAAGGTLNEFVGYYPTVGDAVGELTGRPVPAQVDARQLSAVDPEREPGGSSPWTFRTPTVISRIARNSFTCRPRGFVPGENNSSR